jgi:hypothetical protein
MMRRAMRLICMALGLVWLACAFAPPVHAEPPGQAKRARTSAKKERPKKERTKKEPKRRAEKPPAAPEAKAVDPTPRESRAEHEPNGKRPVEPARPSAQEAARAAAQEAAQGVDSQIVKEGDTTVKVMNFSGLDIEGRLKSPQLLYFVNRVHAEFARPKLPHRSFMPELERSTQRDPFP